MKDFYQAPHQVDAERYKRFDPKNMGFARVRWDKSFAGYGKSIEGKAAERLKQGLPGYTRVGYAMQSAAWTVYATFAGSHSHDRIRPPGAEADPSDPEPDPLTRALGPHEVTDLGAMASVVKRAGQIFGAFATGIAEIDPNWIYSHRLDGEPLDLPDGMRYAVVMLIEMDDFGLDTSPSLGAAVTTGSGYSRMGFASACLSEFIRNLGYTAWASGNDTGLSVPLAVDAGLGEFGRNGLLIAPKVGQRVRICKVFTDLPLETDAPVVFGAKRFCATCMKCAEKCPSRSIPFDREPTWEPPFDSPSTNPGVRKWYVNADTCYEFWTQNTAECSNCIRVCPYTKTLGWHHDAVRFFIHRLPLLNRLWLLGDTLFGYDAQKDARTFFERRDWLGRKRY